MDTVESRPRNAIRLKQSSPTPTVAPRPVGALPSILWQHHYRCAGCHNDWVHVDDAPQAADACPRCTRRMRPYESEICLVLA